MSAGGLAGYRHGPAASAPSPDVRVRSHPARDDVRGRPDRKLVAQRQRCLGSRASGRPTRELPIYLQVDADAPGWRVAEVTPRSPSRVADADAAACEGRREGQGRREVLAAGRSAPTAARDRLRGSNSAPRVRPAGAQRAVPGLEPSPIVAGQRAEPAPRRARAGGAGDDATPGSTRRRPRRRRPCTCGCGASATSRTATRSTWSPARRTGRPLRRHLDPRPRRPRRRPLAGRRPGRSGRGALPEPPARTPGWGAIHRSTSSSGRPIRRA